MRILLLGLGVVAAVGVIGALVGIGWIVSVANSAPDLSKLKAKDPGENSTIYAADGTRLGVVQADILRKPIPSSSIPDVMKQATVAIEDKRFYEHGGVDFEGIVRAAVKNLESDQTVQGGSTLTMQLIKNLYTDDRTRNGVEGYKRKIREAKLAEDLENVHPGRVGKNWVLTKYLNTVPYGTVGGQEAVGVQAAARIFFNKRAHDLTLPEAALLAGLPQAPTDYNPYLHLRKATERRNDVLRQMLGSRDITAAQYQDALSTPVELHRSTYYRQRRENYFFDYVRKELVRRYGRETVRQGGLKVYTTVDLRLQRLARAAIASNLDQPNSPSSAVVSIDPKTGYIKAMASSSNYGDSKFNLATQAKRQPGSTFKMIVLMDALRRGVDINKTSYVSKYLNFIDPATKAKIDVHVAEGHESNRPKSLFEAVVSSDNTVFQQLDLDLGPKTVTQTARDMGVTSHLDSYPAEALGGLTYGVSPLEMARAYVDDQRRRQAHQADLDHQGGLPRRPRRHVAEPAPDQGRLHRRPDLRGHPGHEGQRRPRHGHPRRPRLLPHRGQDRHDERLHRRLVQRDDVEPEHRGVGRLPRDDDVDDERPVAAGRRRDVRRQRPGADLARLHVERRRPQVVPRVAQAAGPVRRHPVLRQVLRQRRPEQTRDGHGPDRDDPGRLHGPRRARHDHAAERQGRRRDRQRRREVPAPGLRVAAAGRAGRAPGRRPRPAGAAPTTP